jgi:hypothetical protein
MLTMQIPMQSKKKVLRGLIDETVFIEHLQYPTSHVSECVNNRGKTLLCGSDALQLRYESFLDLFDDAL